MATLTEVGITAGVPTSGSGTAATLDGVFNRTAGQVIITSAASVTAGSLTLPVSFPATGSTVTIGNVTAATAAGVTAGTLMLPVTFPATGSTVALAAGTTVSLTSITAATAAAVTAATLAIPVAFPATASIVSISTAQLGTLGQAAMATSAPVVIASNQGFSTAAIFPTGPIRGQKGVNIVTIATTTETVIATAVSTTFLDLYGIVLSNTSATATKVTINNATAGTNMAVVQVPAGDTRGFMLPAGSAIPMATAGNNITAVLGTSVSGVVVTALYVKN